MNNVLPKGWVIEKLNNVIEFVKTGINPYEGEIEYYSTGSISENETNAEGSYHYGSKPSRANRLSEYNDVFQARMKETNKALIIEKKLENKLFSTGFIQYRIISNTLNQKFLYYYVKSDNYTKQRDEYATGSTQISLNDKNSNRIIIPLPPLAEQKRIAAKLDAVLPRVEKLKERLDKSKALIKQFRQSVLNAAVTGKLTEEWREKHSNYQEWDIVHFKEIAVVKSNLVNPLEHGEYPHIAPDNIEKETGKLLPHNTVAEDNVKSPKHLFKKGQIIYSKIRPYLSKLIIANFNGLCSADMYPIETILNTKFLYYYMLSDIFVKYASNAGTRSVLPKINQKELGIIEVPKPSSDEQDEIVCRIDKFFVIAEKLEARIEKLTQQIDDLSISVLAKAFCGELVPTEAELAEKENRSYETAEELLEKIEVEKKKLEGERKKARRKHTPSSGKPESTPSQEGKTELKWS